MTDPRAVEAVERLRPHARTVGMTDAELHALVRAIGRSGGGARRAAVVAKANATVTRDMAPQLARRLGVDQIEIAGVGGGVSVHPTLRGGRVIVDKVMVGPSATVGDVLAHRGVIESLKCNNGLAGKIRKTCDQFAAIVTGRAIGRANPYPVFTGAHEAFAEVHKYEAMIRERMAARAAQLGPGGDVAAASRIENEILVMVGELSHWRDVLDEVKRTGDPQLAHGLIEAKDRRKVTDEAIAAGYPVLPSDNYYYRRRPGRGPEDPEFQVVRADANGSDPPLRLRRRGNGWEFEETEGTGKVPRVFEPELRDDEVLADMLAESQSLHDYFVALTDPHGIGLPASAVQARMRAVIELVRSPRGATATKVAAGTRRSIDEDKLRHALKAEFYEEFFECAAREPTPEAQLARFFDLTRGLTTDRGHLREDFLAHRDPGSEQHVVVKHTDHPHLGLTARERYIDRVRTDGTAIEDKSITGRLSTNDLAQLADYKKMAYAKIAVLVAGKLTLLRHIFGLKSGYLSIVYEIVPVGYRSAAAVVIKPIHGESDERCRAAAAVGVLRPHRSTAGPQRAA